MSEEIEIKLPDLARIALEPGDKLLVRHPKRISNAAFEVIGANLKKIFPDHQVLLLDDGLELAVVRTAGPDLADRLDALADDLAADTKNKGDAALRVLLSLRNEADDLRAPSSTTLASDGSL